MNNEENNNKLTTTGVPICCPNCKSKNISFITDYHKCVGLRIVCEILIVLLLFFSAKLIINDILKEESAPIFIVGTIVCAILYVGFKISIYLTEQRTHAKAICRDCGNIWLID